MNRADQYLLLLTFVLLFRVRLGLRVLPFQRLYQRLHEGCQASSCRWSGQSMPVKKIIWAVNVSSRYMPGKVRCLARALTAQAVAKKFGHTLDLHVGVAKDGKNQLEAHAWVTYQEIVVLGALPDLARFIPLPLMSGASK